MDRLEAYERRAWRLAMLLTGGDDHAAEAVVRDCVDAQQSPERLPPARFDRLVIQASRSPRRRPEPRRFRKRAKAALERAQAEHRVHRGRPRLDESNQQKESSQQCRFSPLSERGLAALQSLKPQQRESWILRELDDVDLIEASKSMDCSKTALTRHLESAVAIMRETLGDNHDAVLHALKQDADALDPEPFIQRRKSRRARGRTRQLVIWGFAASFIVVVGVIVWRIFST